jgi:hypothetical protein
MDKSVLQRIAERSSEDRRKVWAQLRDRYDLGVPFVLLEEVLVNLGNPRLIAPRLAATMFRELMKQRDLWLDDEISSVFDELVEKNRRTEFKPVRDAFKKHVAEFAPTSGPYRAFLKERETDADEELQWRTSEQNRAAQWRSAQKFKGEEWFQDEQGRYVCLVSDQKEFFDRFVSPEFHFRDRTPNRWFDVLNRSLGYPEMRFAS